MDVVAIGGIGGSGTRLIAHCLKNLGCDIGSDLNNAYDNLWFTLLFKRQSILEATDRDIKRLWNIFSQRMSGNLRLNEYEIESLNELFEKDRLQHNRAWLKSRVESLLSAKATSGQKLWWGWKEPNTHVVIDRLYEQDSELKYIHVVRNGLDMAYSSNQNQAMLWGKSLTKRTFEPSPRYSLKFWCAVQKRMNFVSKAMGDKFMFLNFDDFCVNSTVEAKRLLTFLDATVTQENVSKVVELIERPRTIGRFKQRGLNGFSAKDIDYVSKCGFDISL